MTWRSLTPPILGAALLFAATPAAPQELEPGAYSPSPVGLNIAVLAYDYRSGNVTFDPKLPVRDVTADVNSAVFGYTRTFGFAGRLASAGLAIPYSKGRVEGIVLDSFVEGSRSGLRDPRLRFAVNLIGVPAMDAREFAAYRQKTNLGVSLMVIAPLGQYDPARIINVGTNRWSFRPELGLSHAAGSWTLDSYAGAWLFTDNPNFFNGRVRAQSPIGSLHFHATKTLRPRTWLALGANFYTGGRTRIDGAANRDVQKSLRFGATFALPLTPSHSVKFNYSRSAFTTIGPHFQAIGVAFQYLWGAGL